MGLRAHIERRQIVRPCEACGAVTADPLKHHTWCAVYIAARARFAPKDMTGTVAA